MLSRETLESYRRMTSSERLTLTILAMEESWPWMLVGPPEIVERRFARLRLENHARTLAIAEKLARHARESHEPSS